MSVTLSGCAFPPPPDAVTVTVLVPAGVPGVICFPLPQAETPEATRRSATASQIWEYFIDGFFLRRTVMPNASTSPGSIPKAAHGPRPNGNPAKELCATGVG